MPCVCILHSPKLSRYYIGFTTDFDTRLDFHLNAEEQRKFTHNAKGWTVFLKSNANQKHKL
jgi:putative endonuclease